jgi:hypothetical protein
MQLFIAHSSDTYLPHKWTTWGTYLGAFTVQALEKMQVEETPKDEQNPTRQTETGQSKSLVLITTEIMNCWN